MQWEEGSESLPYHWDLFFRSVEGDSLQKHSDIKVQVSCEHQLLEVSITWPVSGWQS